MNLDTLPNLSRDIAIFPTGTTPVEEDDVAALFIGGSNADRLANSAATLGIVSETRHHRRLGPLNGRCNCHLASSD